MNHIISGNFYSSAGPEIYDWGIRDGIAYIECSPVCRIDFIAGNHVNDGRSLIGKSFDETLQRGEYQLHGDESFLRVQISDRYGRTAWTNAAF